MEWEGGCLYDRTYIVCMSGYIREKIDNIWPAHMYRINVSRTEWKKPGEVVLSTPAEKTRKYFQRYRHAFRAARVARGPRTNVAAGRAFSRVDCLAFLPESACTRRVMFEKVRKNIKTYR